VSLECDFTDLTGVRYTNDSNMGFIKALQVPEEHAIYTRHMGLEGGSKTVLCTCPDCQTHERYHQENGLLTQAWDWHSRMSGRGVYLDFCDSTDYCLGSDGFVFFEINRFDPKQLKDWINRNGNKADRNLTRALVLLDRFAKIM
jgi:hypothetical protein